MDNNHLLSEIINNNLVETIFQPIADIRDGHIIGYEALSRGPEGTDFYMPIPLISYAKSYNRMEELDEVLCDNTLMHAKKRGLDSLLFINLDTKYIFEQGAVQKILVKLKKYGLNSNQIVIEFSEKSVICMFDSFIDMIQEYRKNGFLLCFDNVGSAYSNLFTVGKIRPDYMKIDRNMTQGIHFDESRKSGLEMEMMIANLLHTTLIAEGVENREDLETLIAMGIPAAQGHLIGQPDKDIKGIRLEALQIISQGAQV